MVTTFRTWIFIPFEKGLNRAGFDCGVRRLNKYIQTQATQDIKRRVSQVYVAVDPTNQKEILGYYSLSSGSIAFASLPPSLASKLPKYPIPIARIGRLAVSKSCQGLGVGEALLMDAFKTIVRVSNSIGIFAVIVDAKDDSAKRFYLKYGFISLPKQPLTLFLPLKTIQMTIP